VGKVLLVCERNEGMTGVESRFLEQSSDMFGYGAFGYGKGIRDVAGTLPGNKEM
jgi:hypothetical protein